MYPFSHNHSEALAKASKVLKYSPSNEYCFILLDKFLLLFLYPFIELAFNILDTVSIQQPILSAVSLTVLPCLYTAIISLWSYRVDPSPPNVAL